MRRVSLKLPDDYIQVFKKTLKELETTKKIIYLYSPPAYGKTTTLLKFFTDKNFNPVFIQIEERDNDIETFKISLLNLLSEFSITLKEKISLIDGKMLSELFFSILEDEYKNISLPENTYFVFLDTYYLTENFGKIIKDIILPVFKSLSCKVVIEANLPFEFEEDVKIIGDEYFTLSVQEIMDLALLFDEKITLDEVYLLKEKTEGWLLPCILFFKDKRETKIKLEFLLEWPEILEGLLEEVFKNLKEEEKIVLLTLGQLREFNYEAISWITGYKNPERMINELKRKGFSLIEEIREGTIIFRFHHLLKSYLERRLKKFPLGYDLFFRIHINALDYFESTGDLENALYHAIKIRDPLKCGKYLKGIVIDLFNQGKISVIESFLKEVEKEGIIKTPEFILSEGIYLNLVEKFKESVEKFEKVIKELKEEDYLIGKYFILIGKEFLGEEEDILIEEGNRLLEEVKEYENMHKIELDFEKDPLRIIKRKTYTSPSYFVFLMYARIYNFLGTLYHSKREIERAIEFYEKSLSFLKKIKDDMRILGVIHNIGDAFLFKGNREALEYFNNVVNYPVLFPDKAMSLNNIGVYYEVFEGDLERAEEYYRKALEVSEKFLQIERISIFYSNLLNIYIKKKEEEKIFKCLQEIEKISLLTKNPGIINSFYLNKTEALMRIDRLKEAEETLRKVEETEILKFEEDKYYKMYIEGKLKYLMGNISEAKKLINESLEWSLSEGSFRDKIEKLYFIYEIYKKFGDPEIIKIRNIAEKLLREKGYLKRLKDFDIEV